MSSAIGTRRLDWILSPEPSLVPDGPGAGLTLGVLALQGDFREHRRAPENSHSQVLSGPPMNCLGPGL